ncbi:MAG: hypothetical protein U0401_25975 [Anaerolineae bacterium]
MLRTNGYRKIKVFMKLARWFVVARWLAGGGRRPFISCSNRWMSGCSAMVKPFNREIDHRAASLFPPLPTVIQGAIRTHYIGGGLSAYLAGKLPEVERVVDAPPPDSFPDYLGLCG